MSPSYRDNSEFVCRCRRITGEDLGRVAGRHTLRSMRDVIRHAHAGDGCTACHHMIKQLLKLSRQ